MKHCVYCGETKPCQSHFLPCSLGLVLTPLILCKRNKCNWISIGGLCLFLTCVFLSVTLWLALGRHPRLWGGTLLADNERKFSVQLLGIRISMEFCFSLDLKSPAVHASVSKWGAEEDEGFLKDSDDTLGSKTFPLTVDKKWNKATKLWCRIAC